MKTIVYHIFNLPWHIAEHVFGEDHTPAHRSIVGMVFILIGIFVMRDHRFMTETLGSTLHGIGIVPVAEHIGLVAKQRKKKQKYINRPQSKGGANRRATSQPCLQCVQ